MKSKLLSVLCLVLYASVSWSFCGFYVAKADTKLFNKASKVILARDGNRTILTMANDYQGNMKDFAIVVPVPVVLQKDQVHVGDPQVLERLDAYSAPRLVEYYDPDPCHPIPMEEAMPSAAAPMQKMNRAPNSLGVKIEAQFTVGEYDIVILSAEESGGLEKWLHINGYQIPAGAAPLLEPYIKSNMKFFVAKVNLKEFEASGKQFLRPIQMAFESPKFMLPIRLGMINAENEQDMVIYALSPTGRTEVTNYRTVQVPSNMDIPIYVKDDFSNFYKSMFKRAYEKEGMNVVFLEYAWNMNWCDPCAADPLTQDELRKAGVFWLDESGQNVYISRLHVRYTRPKFPEDLTFEETPNTENFQGRYILQYPFKGPMKCDAAREYQKSVYDRQEKEAQTLANLTGWDITDIRKKMGLNNKGKQPEKSWWDKVFGDDDDKKSDQR